jgi:hypothetical protein
MPGIDLLDVVAQVLFLFGILPNKIIHTPSYTEDEGVLDRSWSAALEPRLSATAATAELRRSACGAADPRRSARTITGSEGR